MNNSMQRKALGRGLDALLKTGPATATAPAAVPLPDQVAIDEISPNPLQPRRQFEPNGLAELAASIRQQGILQPLLLREWQGKYQLIAGERRLRAAQMAGLAQVPARIVAVNDEQALELTIIENLQREDLNPMEQARAFSLLVQRFHLSQEQVAEKTGKDRSTVANFLRLLKLDPEVQAMLEGGSLSMGHARALASLPVETQLELASKAVAKGWNVRQIEKQAQPAEEKTKTARAVDPNVAEAQEQLERALGTRVKIHDRNNQGRIEVFYANLDEFQRIYTLFVR